MRRLVLAGILLLAGASPAAGRDFPADFEWGVATSGFQTEMGGRPANVDRRSDWWRWTHDPANRGRGTVTRDHPERGPAAWNRWRGDVRLAQEGLGASAFRLGIEWSRIFPRSTRGARTFAALDRLANQRAVRHYAAVLRELRRRGMAAFVTLQHFSLPVWIHDPVATRDALAGRGPDDPLPRFARPSGWLDRSTVAEFRKYSGYLARRLGPLVDFWTPINEPIVVVTNGYVGTGGAQGGFPPGAFSYSAARRAVLRLVEANRVACDAIKRADPTSEVGLVQNTIAFTGDREAVARADGPTSSGSTTTSGPASRPRPPRCPPRSRCSTSSPRRRIDPRRSRPCRPARPPARTSDRRSTPRGSRGSCAPPAPTTFRSTSPRTGSPTTPTGCGAATSSTSFAWSATRCAPGSPASAATSSGP